MSDRIRIRNATAADAPFLAWVMLTASRSGMAYGLWDHMLDSPFGDRLDVLTTYATTAKVHSGHYRSFRIAEVDGQPAAAVSAYDSWRIDPDDDTDALLDTLVAHGWSEARIQGVLKRSTVWRSLDVTPRDGAWILEWVAAAPAFGRSGVLEYLLLNTVAAGDTLGFSASEVRVAIGHASAEQTYRRLGFDVVSQHTSPAFAAVFGTPGVRRMIRCLGPSERRWTASRTRQPACSG